jgi:hypothetical protein
MCISFSLDFLIEAYWSEFFFIEFIRFITVHVTAKCFVCHDDLHDYVLVHFSLFLSLFSGSSGIDWMILLR